MLRRVSHWAFPVPDKPLSLRSALILFFHIVEPHNCLVLIFSDRNFVRVSHPAGLMEYAKAKYKNGTAGRN
jgi:hypothetical protein